MAQKQWQIGDAYINETTDDEFQIGGQYLNEDGEPAAEAPAVIDDPPYAGLIINPIIVL